MAAQKTRDPWFDNAKMALVTLVVIGHAWVLVNEVPAVEHLYDFLYAWHMPAFVLVTGYLSRSFTYSSERIWQLVRTVAVPYVVFECLLALFRIYVGGEDLGTLFVDPHWPMWFLAALFFWRLLSPVFRSMWGGLLAAVLLSLAAGAWAGQTLDVARTLGLLPFFVLGLKATPERLEMLRVPAARGLAVVVLALIAVATYWLDDVAGTEWLYYRSTYADLDVSTTEAVLTRATLLITGTLGAFAFLALVPRVRGWFTTMGAATLIVYLGHGFFIKGASYAGLGDWAQQRPVLGPILVTLAAALLSVALAWRPVAGLLQHLVDPFRRPEQRIREAGELAVTSPEQVVEEAVEQAVEQAAEQPAAENGPPDSGEGDRVLGAR